MSISLLLEMAASSNPDRTAVVSGEMRLTTSELSALADGGAGVVVASGARHVAYVGTGGAMLALLLFSSARAGVAFTPLNYRLSEDGLRQLIDRLPTPSTAISSPVPASRSSLPMSSWLPRVPRNRPRSSQTPTTLRWCSSRRGPPHGRKPLS